MYIIPKSKIFIICLQASKNENVRVVIVTGDPAAGGVFCAGADLSGGSDSFGDSQSSSSDHKRTRRKGRATFRDGGGIAGLAAMNCTKPTIAAINGSAVGVGIT